MGGYVGKFNVPSNLKMKLENSQRFLRTDIFVYLHSACSAAARERSCRRPHRQQRTRRLMRNTIDVKTEGNVETPANLNDGDGVFQEPTGWTESES
ncbi:Hypothetical protein NTJ_07832 [Nesidiocoris tenuis]|uniref:Uncharacterized protein n=1 Tax=Nesidiocoris tenuis TaxID=355587 RepID=A0ABN7AS37_9HEMI|nr:Hypothetical protein NTJ_07832 [Nesidiocoris tenuis]